VFIRVTRGRFSPANYDALQRALEEQVLPHVRHLPGLRSAHLAMDREAGKLVSVVVCETREQTQAVNAPRDAAQTLGTQCEPPKVYEVVLQA
jgi:hypothetical protein